MIYPIYMEHISVLNRYAPCNEAIDWLKNFNSLREAWMLCERGDWLLWIAKKLAISKPKLIIAASNCAELCLAHIPADEQRPALLIKESRKWAQLTNRRVKINLGNLIKLINSAQSAFIEADDAGQAAAIAAAIAVGNIALPDSDDAPAACVDSVARAAGHNSNNYASGRKRALKECAEIVRNTIPWEEIEKQIAIFS